MKVAIVGGAGFIGTNLALALLKEKHTVVSVDEKEEYFRNNVVREAGANIEMLQFNKDTIFDECLNGCDLVFHLISTTCPSTSNQLIAEEVSVNSSITVNILEACIRNGVRKIIYISSGGTVYGDKKCPIREDEKNDPINAYGIQKLVNEKLLFLYNYLYGMDYVVARLSNPYGPYQRPNGKLGALTTFVNKALNDEQINVYGDGSIIRDYIYIDDAINAIVRLAMTQCNEKIYNIGSGVGVSINELLSIIETVVGKPLNVNYLAKRSVDLQMNVLDVSRYEYEFGRLNLTSIEEGIIKLMKFMKLEKKSEIL